VRTDHLIAANCGGMQMSTMRHAEIQMIALPLAMMASLKCCLLVDAAVMYYKFVLLRCNGAGDWCTV
jgi:hypothetical protein